MSAAATTAITAIRSGARGGAGSGSAGVISLDREAVLPAAIADGSAGCVGPSDMLVSTAITSGPVAPVRPRRGGSSTAGKVSATCRSMLGAITFAGA